MGLAIPCKFCYVMESALFMVALVVIKGPSGLTGILLLVSVGEILLPTVIYREIKEVVLPRS